MLQSKTWMLNWLYWSDWLIIHILESVSWYFVSFMSGFFLWGGGHLCCVQLPWWQICAAVCTVFDVEQVTGSPLLYSRQSTRVRTRSMRRSKFSETVAVSRTVSSVFASHQTLFFFCRNTERLLVPPFICFKRAWATELKQLQLSFCFTDQYRLVAKLQSINDRLINYYSNSETGSAQNLKISSV